MGFLDDVQSTIDRGTTAASRATRSVQLKAQLAEASRRREGVCAQLGAALYPRCKDDPAMRKGLEGLFDGIAAIDADCEQCQAQINKLEAEAAAEKEAVAAAAAARQQAWIKGYDCPFCGARVAVGDRFCASCGKSADEMRAAVAQMQPQPQTRGPVCPSCGAPITEGDVFCMNCGAKVEKPAAADAAVAAHPESSVASGSLAGETVAEQHVAASVTEPAPTQAPAPAIGVCPTCGTQIDPDFAFCMNCGCPLK